MMIFSWEKIFRHEQLDPVAAIHSDQGQANSRVPRRGFYDGAAGRKFSFLLGFADNSDRSAVFHAAARIHVFQFGENVGRSGRNQPLQAKHRSAANEVGNVVGNSKMGDFRVLQVHVTG